MEFLSVQVAIHLRNMDLINSDIFNIIFHLCGVLIIRYYGESSILSFNIAIQRVMWILNPEFRCECYLKWYIDVVEFFGGGKLRQSPALEYVTLRSEEEWLITFFQMFIMMTSRF